MSVEKLFFARNVTTAMTVSQARGVVLLCGKQAGMEIYEYTPMQIKLAVTGYGKADKKQMQEMVRATKEKILDDSVDDWATGYFSEAGWTKTSLSEYIQPIPEFVLSVAIRIKEVSPEVKFTVQHLRDPKADPFKGGSAIDLRSYCIPVYAPHPVAAHAWLENWLEPGVEATDLATSRIPVPLLEARAALSSTLLDNQAVCPPAAALAASVQPDISAAGRQLRDQIWTELRL